MFFVDRVSFDVKLIFFLFLAISECRDILHHCQNEQVQFQTSCALKGAFPRDCVDVTKDELTGLMIGLIGIIQSDGCSSQVREQLVAIVAICAKRITGQFKVADGIELVQQRIQERVGNFNLLIQ